MLGALGTLSAQDRTVLLLTEGRGLSVRAISQLTAATESSVRSRLHRSRIRLRAEVVVRLGSDLAEED
ncbi:MAG: sigma factor-like helix-turn-helix DNA-binding protein [Candidatus Dormibacteria bacterium]